MTDASVNIVNKILPIILEFFILALIIERALYQIFDSKLWRFLEKKLDEQVGGDFLDLKPWIAIGVSIWIIHYLNFDIIGIIFVVNYTPGISGPLSVTEILTGLFIAGGSTGFFKFFKKLRLIRKAKLKELGIDTCCTS